MSATRRTVLMRTAMIACAAGLALTACGPGKPKLSAPAKECALVGKYLMRSPDLAEPLSSMGEGDPNVFVYFRAANAYGTPLRVTVWCSMRRSGQDWTVTAANVDGAEVDKLSLLEAQVTADREGR